MRQSRAAAHRAAEHRCLSWLQALADGHAADWGIEPVTVEVNRRLRTTAGRALKMSGVIQVAGWLLGGTDEVIRDTLAHEIAHLVAASLEPKAPPHGDLWRACAVAAGAEPRAHYRWSDLAAHWRRLVIYECARGCEFARPSEINRRRLKLLRCRPHGLPLALTERTEVRGA
ncbi:MAG: hypothetical protein GEU80_15250 [Dehalococcoidia bacterium]|nr:hypothetical protein [Dehalococcoidia bacterium]